MRPLPDGRFVRVHLPFLLWGGVVAAALLMPIEAVHDLPWPRWLVPLRPWSDKLVHGVLFFIMALLGYRSLRTVSGLRYPLIVTAVLVLAYGALLEALQTFSVVRRAEISDLTANAIGVLIFGIATWWVGRS